MYPSYYMHHVLPASLVSPCTLIEDVVLEISFFPCISRVCHGPEVCQQMLTNNESWQRAESGRWRKANAETLINALITNLCSFGLTSVRRINIDDKDKFVESCLGMDARCLSCQQRKKEFWRNIWFFISLDTMDHWTFLLRPTSGYWRSLNWWWNACS